MPDVGAMTGGLGNRALAETNGAGVSLREYIWLGDQVVAVINNANTTTPVPCGVTNDHLGCPVQMTDASRSIVWRAKYRPFGELVAVTGPASLDIRFPGQWFQLESGLAYNWHRHYDASLGRYTQPDPLGVGAGPSVFGYAGQAPQSSVDPQGLFMQLGPFFDWLRSLPNPGPGSCPVSSQPTFNDPELFSPPTITPPATPLTPPALITPMADNGPNLKDMKPLSPGEIKRLKQKGVDPHALKDGRGGSRADLFKDKSAEIYIGGKKGCSEPKSIDLNINELDGGG